jgi:arabinofuranan 3-O-arabinosyltransferase
VVPLVKGRGSFRPMVTDRLLIQFSTVERAYSFEHGEAVVLPVGVGEVRLPGSDVPTVDPDQPLGLECGSGPTITVDGSSTQTRVDATLSMVMSGDALPAEPCGDGRVALSSGSNRIEAWRSQVARPEELTLTRTGVPTTSPTRVGLTVDTWTPTARTVTVAARHTPTLLVVNENINAGWVARLAGRTLAPQRVDGWQQGWVVPPGGAAKVVLRFTPNPTYHWGLLGGLVALVAVAAAAAVPSRRRRGTAGTGDARWLVVATTVVVGGLLAGWVGLAAMAAALLLGGAVTRSWPAYAAGGSLALAGVAQAVARADTFEVHSTTAQSLAFLGVVLAAAAFGANGPAFFRRRKGRSST